MGPDERLNSGAYIHIYVCCMCMGRICSRTYQLTAIKVDISGR